MVSASVVTITLLYLMRSHDERGVLSTVSREGEYRLNMTAVSRTALEDEMIKRKVRLIRRDDLESMSAASRLLHLILVFWSLLSMSAMLIIPAVKMSSTTVW